MRPTCAPCTGQLEAAGLRPQLLVDCSHANSAKDHTRQAIVFRDVLAQRAAGDRGIIGLMLESHLFAGKQALGDGAELSYGVSVTDACIGWDETVELLRRGRRHARGAGRSARVASARLVAHGRARVNV